MISIHLCPSLVSVNQSTPYKHKEKKVNLHQERNIKEVVRPERTYAFYTGEEKLQIITASEANNTTLRKYCETHLVIHFRIEQWDGVVPFLVYSYEFRSKYLDFRTPNGWNPQIVIQLS